MNLFERVNSRLKMSEFEYRYAFYSPKKNEIVLVRQRQIWVDKNNEARIEFKSRSNLYGSTMNADKFFKKYSVCLGDIGLHSEYFEIKKELKERRE